jgi:hypothetical protein
MKKNIKLKKVKKKNDLSQSELTYQTYDLDHETRITLYIYIYIYIYI